MTTIRPTGNFTQVGNNPKKNYSLAYNSDKNLLYKIVGTDVVTVVFDEVCYNAQLNRQFRFSSDFEMVSVQTRENEIQILRDIENTVPSIFCSIFNIPGDVLIDFKHIGRDLLVCLSRNGFLSCFDISQSEGLLITVKKLQVEQGEHPISLEINSEANTICVAGIKLEGSQHNLKTEASGKSKTFVYDHVNIHIMHFDYDKECLIDSYDKPFKIECEYSETDYVVEMNLKNCFKQHLILFMVLSKEQSQTVAFLIKQKRKILPISSYNLKLNVCAYEIWNNELWVIGECGSVKVLV